MDCETFLLRDLVLKPKKLAVLGEVRNEWRGPSPRLSAWATQQEILQWR